MTEGISKEKLIKLYIEKYSEEVTEELLLSECTELDPWLPIDENTPKDRPILVFNGVKYLAQWDYCLDSWSTLPVFWAGATLDKSKLPTHYKLLPEDPK